MTMKAVWMACVLNFLLAATTVAGDKITVRADAWPPYNGDPAGELPGYGIEILKAAFEKQGYTIDYETVPWTRAVAECQKGAIDSVIGATEEEGEGLILPKEAIGSDESTFFVKKGSAWTYQGAESLKNIHLGTIEGYTYCDEVTAYIEANKGSEMIDATTGDDALEKNIRKLLAGRIDAIIENAQVVKWTAKNLKIEEGILVKAGVGSAPEALYVAFAKGEKGEKLAKLFDEGIAALRASGELKKILDKYNVSDWK